MLFLKSGFNDYFGSGNVKARREESLSSTFYIILMFLLWTETVFPLSFSLGILSVVGMISSRREIVLSSDVEEYCTHFLLTGRWRGAIKSKAARGPEKSACRRTIFFFLKKKSLAGIHLPDSHSQTVIGEGTRLKVKSSPSYMWCSGPDCLSIV